MSSIVITWWIYVVILVLLSFVLIVGYILRNINVSRPVERLESQHESTTVSAQTSFIADRNVRRTRPINLKEDKRTLKSLSLVFSKDKSPAYTNLHDIVNDQTRGKTLVEKIIRLDSSANTDKDSSRCITPFSATSNSKGLSNSKLCIQDVANSELRLIKNVSSSKGNVIFGKSDEVIILKDSIKDILPSVKDTKSQLIDEEIEGSNKYIASVSLETDKTLFKNVQKPEQNNTNLHEEPTTPIDFHKDLKQFSTVEENVNSSNKKSIIINDTIKDISASPRYENTSKELITPKESYKINSPSKLNEDNDKNDEQIVNNNDSSKDNLYAITDTKYNNEFIKAKDSVPNMLRYDKNINENVEGVYYTKDHASIVISTSNTDMINRRSNNITSKICKEPSSLFFSTLAPCPPCTPKEMFAPYENALNSGKPLKTDTCNKNTIPVTGSKHAADVRFHPETKTSYFQAKKDEIASNLKTGLSQISYSKSKLYEMAGTKDNISKSASRVTFAKNEIVLKDSVSMVDHVCVVNPTTAALANDYKTIRCNEFEVETESNIELEESTTADPKDKTKKDTSNPYKRDFVNEAVTVTNIFDPLHRNQKTEKITDSYNYDVEQSQTFSEQSENKSENDFLSKEDHLNTKLVERLPTVSMAKDEEFTSRSLATVFKNDDCTSCNNVHHSEVIIVNNISGSSTKAEKTSAEKNVDELKNEILEIDDKVGTLPIEMIILKSVKDNTNTDEKNQTEDDGENS